MRLLLIEDDREIGAFVRSGLSEAGFTVDFAETGAEAIQMQFSEPYDLLIVDLMLPDMDGLEIIEAIRRKQVNTPVLILSAKRSVDDRVKGLQKGGDDLFDLL